MNGGIRACFCRFEIDQQRFVGIRPQFSKSITIRVLEVIRCEEGMVARTGFEPVISTLKGWRPRPLDERATTKARFLWW